MQQAKLFQFGLQGVKRPKIGSSSGMDQGQNEDSDSDDDDDNADGKMATSDIDTQAGM